MAYILTHGIIVVALDVVNEESMKKGSELTDMPMPLSDSDEVECWDFTGCTREIKISGTISGANPTALMTAFVDKMDAIVDGDQDIVSVYHSDFYALGAGTGDFNVKVQPYKWTYIGGESCSIKYDITMTECV